MTYPRRRIMISRPGGYGVFRMDETPIAPPGPGEVQVEVKACGVNFADVIVRLGLYAAARGLYPICPGLEFSGVVGQVGGGIRDLEPGQRVFGVSRFGCYATAVNALREHLWPLPDGWGFHRGAAFPVAYLTAWYALFAVGHLRGEDRVLVHSAAGGVGTALLHLLSIAGNRTVGVVGRREKVPFALEAGADEVIDKDSEDLWKRAEACSPEGYDIILDANGASTLKESYHHLRPGGRLLVYGFASMLSRSGKRNTLKLLWTYLRTPRFNPLHLSAQNRTVSGFNLIHLFDRAPLFREAMSTLLDWNADGRIPPMHLTAFSFQDAAGAHRAMESGNTAGKLLLLTDV